MGADDMRLTLTAERDSPSGEDGYVEGLSHNLQYYHPESPAEGSLSFGLLVAAGPQDYLYVAEDQAFAVAFSGYLAKSKPSR